MNDYYGQDNPYTNNQQNSAPQYGYGYQNESYGQTVRSIASEEVVAKSFLFMFFGLLFTAFAAFTVSPLTIAKLFNSNGYILLVLAELGVVIAGGVAINKDQPILAAVLYTVYCYLTGATFSIFFVVFELSSLVSIFLITAIIFGIMAVYGMVTKRDLTKISTFLFMGLIGIILVSLMNVFILHSSSLDLLVSIIGVVVFMAYTAFDTQKIKNIALEHPNRGVLCIALYGGFQLYLDFINLFLKLLRILGKRK